MRSFGTPHFRGLCLLLMVALMDDGNVCHRWLVLPASVVTFESFACRRYRVCTSELLALVALSELHVISVGARPGARDVLTMSMRQVCASWSLPPTHRGSRSSQWHRCGQAVSLSTLECAW